MSDEDIKKIIFSGVKEVFPGRNHSQKIENFVDLATSGPWVAHFTQNI